MCMRILYRFLPLLAAGLLSFAAKAQTLDPIATDRPDQTESPFVTPVNYVQVETGFNIEQIDEAVDVLVYPTMLSKFGISNRFEFRLITEQIELREGNNKERGWLPVQVGFKSNLVSQKGAVPEVSFIGHLVLPEMASENFRAKFYAANFRFLLQHDLCDWMSIGYNLGAEWDGFTPEPTFIYTFTTAFKLSSRLGMYAEVFGFAPQERAANHQADGGFTWLINNDVQLDLSAGTALTDNAPDYYTALGISFRLPTKR